MKEVLELANRVEEFDEPIETPYGKAYLMHIPNKPSCVQTNFNERKYNISFVYRDEFYNAVVDIEESNEYEAYPGCPVIIVGRLYDKVRDGKTYKNIALRGWIILSDKEQDKKQNKPERKR